jgi:nitrile hydratase subunit beta
MNGAHDMGGRMGFGNVLAEANEPVFHWPWEARVFGLAYAVGEFGRWTLDEDRHACENQSPGAYLRHSYYETWLAAFEKLAVAKGLVSKLEIESGKAQGQGENVSLRLKPEHVWNSLTMPGSYLRGAVGVSAFRVGDRVKTKNLQTRGHTRLPGYLRGSIGEVVRCHGAHVFPDTNAHELGENPHWLYSVKFAASALWSNESVDHIHADLWEPYLEPA